MSTALDSIISGVLEDLAVRKKVRPDIEKYLIEADDPLDCRGALLTEDISIIAEVKRSSPSKGELAKIEDPIRLAREYEDAGAAVVSVLTEERRFKGSISDFEKIREHLRIPMLRKDFIVDEYQVIESRVIGADLLLLIVAALSQSQLRDYYQIASELSMNVLFEVHSLDELELAMAIGPKIVGVNSRNLKTLEVDPRVFSQIIPKIPNEIIKIAESGISNRGEVVDLENLGVNGILVGETLVRSSNPGTAIAELMGR